ncbi:MAG TPA: exosortase/archaeosortase family protein [Opitutaceae bacterium]|jgi:exosortase|nr:exosortase/archaeosortase family protein [Opitutaceae bacterium]
MTPAHPYERLRLAPLAWINLALLSVLAAALSVLLWPQWRHNPELSHGLFMPLIFLLLLHESRAAGPARFLPAHGTTAIALVSLLAAGLAALAAGGLFTAALDWSHALVGFTLAFALVLILLAGLLVFASEPVRLVPFNWISFTAIFLWLLCAPIPPGTYMRLTLGLQMWVTRSVLTTLHLLGVAAIRNGNLIELARTTVGVEEACSGVRSLISCVFAGFFFSAALVRRPSARVLVIALAAPLALAMNFLRSLTLTLLANQGVDISKTWHDATGYAILGVTALMLGGLALVLARGETASAPPPSAPSSRAPRALQPWLAAGLTLAIALVVLFAANTRRGPADAPVPDLAAMLPAQANGWEVQTTNDLYRFADTLQTDHLVQRTYLRHAPDGSLLQVTIYIAYWAPGQAPVSLVASHTPDACWPGAGWLPEPTADSRTHLVIAGRGLPESEFRFFRGDTYPQRVWFWHLYDGRPIAYQSPYSPRELLRLAWKYGFGHEGAQFFVRISSNGEWAAFADEPLLRGVFNQLQPYGL